MLKRSATRTKLVWKDNFFTVQLVILLIECCIAAVLLSVAAAIISMQIDPAALILPASMLVLYITVIWGGAISARLWNSFLFSSIVSGSVLFLLTVLLSFLPLQVPGCGLSASASIFLRFLMIPAAVFGAWIGRKRQKHAGKHKKRRH